MEKDENTARVRIVSVSDVSWGMREAAYLLKSNEQYVVVSENEKIYRIPWATICYIEEVG